MDWTNPRYPLNYSIEKNSNVVFVKEKHELLDKYNHSCCYCGGKYYEYLRCFNIGKKIEMACRVCYIITHLNNEYDDKIGLYHSTMPQIDILKKTINYIVKYDKIPYPHIIDENVKKVNISVREYIAILMNNKKFDNFRFFIEEGANLNFLVNNIDKYKSPFDKKIVDDNNIKKDIDVYVFSEEEDLILKTIFV
jgi:hypothetical protein